MDEEIILIPQRDTVSEFQKLGINNNVSEEDEKQIIATCLITGNKEQIARLHTSTSILGAKSNAKIVSFQKSSGFDSYGKEQAFNAPISIKAEAAYSTALKHLISSSTNKKIIADTTVLFWAQKTLETINVEEVFSWALALQKSTKDNPDQGVELIKTLYDAVFTGNLPRGNNNLFYVLGLAPNAARISVRFWKAPSVE